jgi:quercetin dioxygenase-like cupin family protein
VWWAGAAPANTQIQLEQLPLTQGSGVTTKPVMAGAIREVAVDLVTVGGAGQYFEPSRAGSAVVWLVLDGRGTLRTKGHTFEVEGETIARAPQGWDWRIQADQGSTLRLLRVRRDLTPGDAEELKKFPQYQAAPHVKKFKECTPYGEAIKSPKTVSRTLLPENYVPRMAMGTVETSGPDAVGAHRHPMLEQLFLGLRGNDITVTADEAKANLAGFSILHIPLGSNHGAQVEAGKKLHYVWMDFFMAKEGQEWLKMHKPLEAKEP